MCTLPCINCSCGVAVWLSWGSILWPFCWAGAITWSGLERLNWTLKKHLTLSTFELVFFLLHLFQWQVARVHQSQLNMAQWLWIKLRWILDLFIFCGQVALVTVNHIITCSVETQAILREVRRSPGWIPASAPFRWKRYMDFAYISPVCQTVTLVRLCLFLQHFLFLLPVSQGEDNSVLWDWGLGEGRSLGHDTWW